MTCLFEFTGLVVDSLPEWQCRRCENIERSAAPPVRTCSGVRAVRKLWNFARAIRDYAADGFTPVTKDEYKRRLAICRECPHREDLECAECGCDVVVKAKARAWQCPLGKWSDDEQPAISLLENLSDARTFLVRFQGTWREAMQFQTVLRHLKYFRPEIQVDAVCPEVCLSALRPMCRQVDSDPDMIDGYYDCTIEYRAQESSKCYATHPSGWPERFVAEAFGAEVFPEMSRYEMLDSPKVTESKHVYIDPGRLGSPWFRERISKLAGTYGFSSMAEPYSDDRLGWLQGAKAILSIEGDAAWAGAAFGIPTLMVWITKHPLHHFGPVKCVRHLVPASDDHLIHGRQDICRAWFRESYDWRSYENMEESTEKQFKRILSRLAST